MILRLHSLGLYLWTILVTLVTDIVICDQINKSYSNSNQKIEMDLYNKMQADPAFHSHSDKQSFSEFTSSETSNGLNRPVQTRRKDDNAYRFDHQFIQIYHPRSRGFLIILPDGTLSHTKTKDDNNTLFQMNQVNGTFSVESLCSCRNLCIGYSGNAYTLPLNDAQHSLECRFNHKNYQLLYNEDILASATHFNNSHVLTMTLWQDVQWRAEWLNRSDTSPPTAMIVNLVSMSYFNAKKLVAKNNFDRIAATKYRKSYCQSLQEVKQVQRNVPSWEDNFATEHFKCGHNRHCIEQIRIKCLNHGLKLLGKVNHLTDCLFPLTEPKLKSNKCWKLQYKSITQSLCLELKYQKCQKDLKKKKSNWSPSKVSKKCQIRRKIEKCMIKQRKRKSKRRRNPSRLARKWCRQRYKKVARKFVFPFN